MRIYPERGVGSVIIMNETSSFCKRTQAVVDRMFLN